jgi:hypothetical protein
MESSLTACPPGPTVAAGVGEKFMAGERVVGMCLYVVR